MNQVVPPSNKRKSPSNGTHSTYDTAQIGSYLTVGGTRTNLGRVAVESPSSKKSKANKNTFKGNASKSSNRKVHQANFEVNPGPINHENIQTNFLFSSTLENRQLLQRTIDFLRRADYRCGSCQHPLKTTNEWTGPDLIRCSNCNRTNRVQMPDVSKKVPLKDVPWKERAERKWELLPFGSSDAVDDPTMWENYYEERSMVEQQDRNRIPAWVHTVGTYYGGENLEECKHDSATMMEKFLKEWKATPTYSPTSAPYPAFPLPPFVPQMMFRDFASEENRANINNRPKSRTNAGPLQPNSTAQSLQEKQMKALENCYYFLTVDVQYHDNGEISQLVVCSRVYSILSSPNSIDVLLEYRCSPSCELTVAAFYVHYRSGHDCIPGNAFTQPPLENNPFRIVHSVCRDNRKESETGDLFARMSFDCDVAEELPEVAELNQMQHFLFGSEIFTLNQFKQFLRIVGGIEHSMNIDADTDDILKWQQHRIEV